MSIEESVLSYFVISRSDYPNGTSGVISGSWYNGMRKRLEQDYGYNYLTIENAIKELQRCGKIKEIGYGEMTDEMRADSKSSLQEGCDRFFILTEE